jgi:RNA polymerase sigma-70 factor, ECF subfamily
VSTMSDPFEQHRAHLFGVAYRMLGSASEAEDVLQDAWLRMRDVQDEELRSRRAYLTRVVVRLCLDVLRSGRRTKESYVGTWLPEPIASGDEERSSSLSFALLLLLESLSPLERAAFLLHEVFDYTHAEIASVVERDEVAVRKLVSRAREHVQEGRPRFSTRAEDHQRMLAQFMTTVATGDLGGLEALLAEEVVMHTDGGGRKQAALKPLVGRAKTAKFCLWVAQNGAESYAAELGHVNGAPAILISVDGQLDQVLAIDTDGERITAIYAIRNPDKLARATPAALA